ncbi:MAG: NAD(P)(+) transhydrogenase (Re/Si-specific) subunit beta [Planctomycetota bacterium]
MSGAADLAYLAAALLLAAALKAMTSRRTARRGVRLGAAGIAVAAGAALLHTPGPTTADPTAITYVYVVAGVLIGAVIGAAAALAVRMIAVPPLVALFNGLGGLASALVVLAALWTASPASALYTGRFAVACGISTLIGWATFTGSLTAFARGRTADGAPVVLPRHHAVVLGGLAGAVVLIVLLGLLPPQRWLVVPLAVLAAGLGAMLVGPIRPVDMPAAISMLTGGAGLAAAVAGIALGSAGLIIGGALVGASGIVLARRMCRAINRSPAAVLLAAVGAAPGEGGPPSRRWTVEDAADVLGAAAHIIIIPGYGLAVARAQHAVKDLSDVLTARGARVQFAIHPAAGRLPGHMNVLLAEAQVPGEQQVDLDAVNGDFPDADVALVIGGNDIVNTAARTDKASALYGMPILDAARARTVLIITRSDGGGFAGAGNPLFHADNAAMILGDAGDIVARINETLKRDG